MKPLGTVAALACVGLMAAGCQTTDTKQAYQAALKPAVAPEQGTEPEPADVPEPPDPADIADGRDVTASQQQYKTYDYADLNPGERPAKNTDEAGLWMAMDRAEKRLATGGNLITDPALNRYVRRITCALAGDYCGDIRVYILRQPQFNASMSPNGMMNVYSGLLLRSRNEAQLATVLGHEIGHYLRRHSAQRVEDIVNKTSGLVAFQLVTAALGVPTVGSLASLAAQGSIASFSRNNEREADGYGLLLMGRAGYSPHEASKVWTRLKREYASAESRKRSVFYASHPSQDEREAVLKDLAGIVEVEGGVGALNEAEYQAAIAPHRFGFLQDELGKRDPATFEPLLDLLIEDGFDTATLHYFKGEMYRVRGDDEDAERALAEFAKAEEAESAPAELFRSKGLVLRRLGRAEEANAAFGTYLDRAPQADDRDMIQFMMTGATS